jgi:hypothetical protein
MAMAATDHNLRSSYREMLLEHLFAGAVMRHIWLTSSSRVEMLKPQVDDGGYDLVLEANGIVRHIQLKASHRGAKTSGVNLNLALERKPSGCVIWMQFDPDTLAFDHFLWFGGAPGQRLPSLETFRIGTHAKANAQGIKTKRPNIRTVPKAKFERLSGIKEIVDRLFGDLPNLVSVLEPMDITDEAPFDPS